VRRAPQLTLVQLNLRSGIIFSPQWLGSPAITPIGAALQHNNTLSHLFVSGVALDQAGSAALADAVAHCASLRTLRLSVYGLDAKRLFVGLRGSRLEELQLDH